MIQRGIRNRSEPGGPWEDLGLHKPAEEGPGPAWAGEVDQQKPARGPGMAGVSWHGPINWGPQGLCSGGPRGATWWAAISRGDRRRRRGQRSASWTVMAARWRAGIGPGGQPTTHAR